MTIWIDIAHTPQFNFYKNLILRLSAEGHQVLVTVLDRGKTPIIVKNELNLTPNVSIFIIGKHRFNKISAIVDANLLRIIKLYFWSLNKKIDITFSNAFVAAFIGWLRGITSYTFDDDPQTYDYKLKLWFSNISHYCLYKLPKNYHLSSKAILLQVLKEWAYLAPSVFKPDESVLAQYKLKAKEYIFIREVSVGTINYANQKVGAVLDVAVDVPKNKAVVFSLEEKSRRNLYPENWILLQEPLKDVHSLIYYSAGLISSGDSMAREAALLGVPSYYLGIRYDMPANSAASEVANLNNQESMDFHEWGDKLSMNKLEQEVNQENIRNELYNKFVDINEYMYSLVTKHI